MPICFGYAREDVHLKNFPRLFDQEDRRSSGSNQFPEESLKAPGQQNPSLSLPMDGSSGCRAPNDSSILEYPLLARTKLGNHLRHAIIVLLPKIVYMFSLLSKHFSFPGVGGTRSSCPIRLPYITGILDIRTAFVDAGVLPIDPPFQEIARINRFPTFSNYRGAVRRRWYVKCDSIVRMLENQMFHDGLIFRVGLFVCSICGHQGTTQCDLSRTECINSSPISRYSGSTGSGESLK